MDLIVVFVGCVVCDSIGIGFMCNFNQVFGN